MAEKPDDKIDKVNDDAQRLLLKEIGDKLSGGKRSKVFKTLYKADKEVDVSDFHDSCDSKGPTVTLLHGKHNTLFGGYTSKDWLSTDKQVRKRDTEAFLFYRNLNQKGCVFMPVKKEKAGEAITCHANFGPTFGGSSKDTYDLQVFKHDSKSQSKYTDKFMVLNGMLKPGKSYEVCNPKETKNEINSGKLDVTHVEVIQVLDDEDDLQNNWREEPWDFEEMKQELIAMELHPRLGVKQYNILLVGAVGTGKSSFCNTIGTVFSENVTPYAVVGATEKSLTNEKKEYDIETKDDETLKIRLIDIRGIGNDRGLEHEFRLILDGRLPPEFPFSENQQPVEKDQLIEATLNEEIHLVCFVTDYNCLESIPASTKGHFDFVKDTVINKGLQKAVIVTKMDQLCPGIVKDVDHIYRCAKARDATVKASAVFGTLQNQVFPIVNYTNETKTNRGIDRLALQALYEMHRLAGAIFKNKLKGMPKHDNTWGNRTHYTRQNVKKESERPEFTSRRMKLTEKLSEIDDKDLRILCVGPSRSGKSSFIDSLLSTFRHKIRSDATGGNTDESSATTKFQLYQIKYENETGERKSSNVYLADMPGIQEEGGLQLKDIKLIVKGHVANKCKIVNGVYKDPKTNQKNRIHCVCFVFDLYTVEKLSNSTLISKCCELKTWLTRQEIPFVVVVTNCDRVSEAVRQNPTRIFEDRRIKECKDKIVELFRVKESLIYPVQNYINETTTVPHIESLLLNVIEEVLSLGYEHLEDLRTDQEADEDSDENGSESCKI